MTTPDLDHFFDPENAAEDPGELELVSSDVADYVSHLAVYAAPFASDVQQQIRESLPEGQRPAFDTALAVHADRTEAAAGKARKQLAEEAYNRLQAREDAIRRKQEEEAAERGSVGSRILTYAQLRDLPRPRPLIWDVAYSGSVGVLLGDSQTGKTWVMLSIAAAAARGIHWPEAPKDPTIKTPKPMPVLYVAAEDCGSIGARLEHWERAHGADLTAVTFHSHPSAINLLDDVQIDELCDAIREYGYRFIVFDTVAASLGGEEEGNPQFSKVVQNMRKVVAATDGEGSAFLVHHFGKDKTKGGRGGSSLFNDSDIVWELDGNLDQMEMECKKWKADSIRRSWFLRLDRADKNAVHIVACGPPASGAANIAADPTAVLEQGILKAVQVFAAENQGYGPSGNTIAGYLRQQGIPIRETAYRDSLALMVSDGRLMKKSGANRSMLYRLPPAQGYLMGSQM